MVCHYCAGLFHRTTASRYDTLDGSPPGIFRDFWYWFATVPVFAMVLQNALPANGLLYGTVGRFAFRRYASTSICHRSGSQRFYALVSCCSSVQDGTARAWMVWVRVRCRSILRFAAIWRAAFSLVHMDRCCHVICHNHAVACVY
jgi:hypothetical protein